MTGESGSNSDVDDLIELSGKTDSNEYLKLFVTQQIADRRGFIARMGPEVNIARNEVGQLNALIARLEASEDVGEVWDTIICLRDEQRKAETKLVDLQYWLTVAEKEIVEKQKQLNIMDTQAIDDQAHLANYDSDNEIENDDLGYHSEEYFDDAHEDYENNHSNGNVVKRGITRLYKFRMEYGKPDGVKLSVTFNVFVRVSEENTKHCFRGFFRRHRLKKREIEHVWKNPTVVPLWLKGRVTRDGEYQDDELVQWELNLYCVMQKDNEDQDQRRNLAVNRSADEEGETTILGCDQNDASIRKEMQKRETIKSVGAKRRLDQFEGSLQVMIHNQRKCVGNNVQNVALKEIQLMIAEVDAAFIPDVGSNGCTTVLDAVGGFVAWPKISRCFLSQTTPPSNIQMITVENKTAPKVPTKRKNFYVSSDAKAKDAIRRGVRRP
ncbi:hypothetical protein Tco_1313540 [Tanacetum coccineum]